MRQTWIIVLASLIAVSSTICFSETSRENRQGLSYSATASISATWSPVLAPGIGAGLSALLDPRTTADVEYTRSSAIEFYGNEQLEMYMNFFALKIRRYLGNSFYVHGGIGSKRFQVVHTGIFRWNVSGSKEKTDMTQHVTTYGPNLGIGNRWQWSHFTLGADWLDIYFPAVRPNVSEEIGDTAEEGKADELRERASRRTDNADLVIRLSLGASF